MPYNYSKLRGKIREMYGTETSFAEAMGLINRSTLSIKLNGKAEWTQGEIEKIMVLIKEPTSKIGTYFFSK